MGVARAEPPTTQNLEQRLIALAPVLSSADRETRSLDVQVVIPAGNDGRLSVRALYQAPDRYALYLCDARDGALLWANVGERVLLYDPIDGVLRSTTGRPTFALRATPDGLSINWGAKVPGETPPSLLADLRSLVRFPVKASAQALGGGRYTLLQTSAKGNQMESQIDENRPCPYVRIQIGEDNVYAPLRMNEPVDPRAFEMPTDEELKHQGFTVVPLADAESPALAKMGSVAAMLRIAMVRLAAHDPDVRDHVERMPLPPIDWQKVTENDEKLSPLLRELFPHAMVRPAARDAEPTSAPGAGPVRAKPAAG